MKVRWASSGLADLVRLHDHLGPKSPEAADAAIKRLVDAVTTMRDHPLLGEKLDAYAPRAVRKIVVGNYELRYEVTTEYIYVLRIWHGRESRGPGSPDDVLD